MKISFLFVEIAALLLFILGLNETRKRGFARLLEFVMIFFYGLLLEALDMKIFKTYRYGRDFIFWVGPVPVAIAWLWAVILASSMAISDRLGLPETIRPFADALLAVWMDLSIDAIAIRVGYWSWVIPLNQGWFGVPAGNLYAWMWVAFFYSALARVIRRLSEKQEKWIWAYLILPVFAYAGLFVAMNSLGVIAKALHFTTQRERLAIFGTQFLIFAVVVAANWLKRKESGERVAAVWWWGRFSIHGYFLAAFFLLGIFRNIPILGVIAVLILAGERALCRWLLLTPTL